MTTPLFSTLRAGTALFFCGALASAALLHAAQSVEGFDHGPDHPIYTTYSDDDGKTWAPLQRTAMIGHPVDLIQLADGRIMATYGIRPGRHTTPSGIRACFSRDDGATRWMP